MRPSNIRLAIGVVALSVAILPKPVFGAAAAFLSYPSSTAGGVATVPFQTPGFNVTVDSSNSGDWRLSFGGAGFDAANGVLIPAAYPQYGTATGDHIGISGNAGRAFIEVPGRYTEIGPVAGFANGWLSLTDISGNGTEANFDLGFVYLPYSEGWIGGTVAVNGTIRAGNTSGVTVIKDPDDAGRWTLSIAGVNSLSSGMLFTVGGDNSNSGNMVSSEPRADGSGWDIVSYDQGATFTDNDGDADVDMGSDGTFHFAYLPYSTKNLIGGRIDDDGTILNSTGEFTMLRFDTGRYLLQIPDGNGGFLGEEDGFVFGSSSKAASLSGPAVDPDDNFLEFAYNKEASAWEISSFDLHTAPRQDTEFVFGFTRYATPLEVPEPTVSVGLLTGLLLLTRRGRRSAA